MLNLSVITINYNNREGLYRTLESVRLQNCKDFEYIVIDGGSSDGSLELLEEYEQYIDIWVSEPDKGIYEAMNKGVRKAKGKYCLFLNSGDWFHTDSVIRLSLPYLNSNKDLLIGFQISAHKSGQRRRYNQCHPELMTMWRLIYCSIPHQATFIKRELLEKFPYNQDYKIVSDWKFFLDLYARIDVSAEFIPVDIADFDTSGVSSTCGLIHRKERMTVLDDYLHPKLLAEITQVPLEAIEAFMLVPKDGRLQRYIVKFIKLVIRGYAMIRPECVLFKNKDSLSIASLYKDKQITVIDFDLEH